MGARHLISGDVAAASLCAARAFADDPLVRWLAGDENGAADLESSSTGFFGPAIQMGIVRGHTYGIPTENGFDAVAVWSPPDVPMMRDDEQTAFGAAFHGVFGDDALMRLAALGELAADRHPGDPHFYLFIVGAATRGKGAGAAVLSPVLDQCDAQGFGAYLESSTPRNHGFYERLGFERSWQERPEPDGPLMTGMFREPRP